MFPVLYSILKDVRDSTGISKKHLKSFFILTQGHFFPIVLLREEGRERNINGREKHLLVASHMPLEQESYLPGQGWNPQPSVCPDRELNLQPFSYRMMFQPTEPHWPGRKAFLTFNIDSDPFISKYIS